MPPSDDRRDSPALRPEGPQQDEPFTELERDRVNKVLFGRVSERTRIRVMAAVSASRTAQAPQQEELDLAPIKVRQKARSKIEHLHGNLCLSALEGQEASNDCADLIAEIERHRARIQVLETSVAYLRYLVDHPVTNPLPAPAEGEALQRHEQ